MHEESHSSANLKQRTIKGIAWTAVSRFSDQLINVAVFFVLARLLTPAAFGLAAMAATFIAFVRIFADQGMSKSIIQKRELDEYDLDTAFWTVVLMGLMLTAVGILLSGAVANLFNEPELQPIVAVLSTTFLITSFSNTQQSLMQRNMQFRALAVRTQAAHIFSGAAAVAAALAGFGVWSLVIQAIVMSLVSVVTLWSVSSWRPGLHFSLERFRELFGFGSNMVGLSLMGYLKTRSDDLLIGYFLGPVALGYYTVAYRLTRMVLELMQSVFGSVSFPVFARLQHKPAELQQAFLRFVHTTAAVSFPSFMAMIVLAPTIIVVLFGQQWIPSIVIMQILSLAGFTMSIGYYSGNALVATNRPNLALRLDLLLTSLSVAAFYLAVPYGIVWVATAFTIVRISYYFVYLFFVHRQIRFNLHRYAAGLIAPGMAAALMGGFAFMLNRWVVLPVLPIVQLIIVVSVSLLAYSAALLILQPSLLHEVVRPAARSIFDRGVRLIS